MVNRSQSASAEAWYGAGDMYDPDELAEGLKEEFEHTDDPDIALRIAMDHLDEQDDYYTRLEIAQEADIEDLKDLDEDESFEWLKLLGAFAAGAGLVLLVKHLREK